MGLEEIKFTGLLQNRNLSQISSTEFANALRACGWREGHSTERGKIHFFRELKKDGPLRGVKTPNDLVRAIAKGRSEPAGNGKTLHRICNGSAYIIYNRMKRILITFSHGNPPRVKSSTSSAQSLVSQQGKSA